MLAPAGFYESIAAFDPYNAHLIQDIGAFQLGLAATLVLAAFLTNDALTAALIGVGVGALAHVVSHLLSLDSGGNPQLDIPSLSILSVLLLVAGAMRWRRRRMAN
jgi:membrane protein implicated in regulation of membrane protease activity